MSSVLEDDDLDDEEDDEDEVDDELKLETSCAHDIKSSCRSFDPARCDINASSHGIDANDDGILKEKRESCRRTSLACPPAVDLTGLVS